MKKITVVTVLIICILLPGCTKISSVKNLPGEKAFLTEMKQYDRSYKLKIAQWDPDGLEIDVYGELSEGRDFDFLFQKTARYLFSDEVFPYITQPGKHIGPIEDIRLNMHPKDERLSLKLAPGVYPEAEETTSLLSGYYLWGITMKELGGDRWVGTEAYFTEDSFIDTETGEPVNWDDFLAQIGC